jgi:hypothetical protein
VDSVWEQIKLKAGKILENGDDWAREQSTATTIVPGALVPNEVRGSVWDRPSQRMSAGAPRRPMHALLARRKPDGRGRF